MNQQLRTFWYSRSQVNTGHMIHWRPLNRPGSAWCDPPDSGVAALWQPLLEASIHIRASRLHYNSLLCSSVWHRSTLFRTRGALRWACVTHLVFARLVSCSLALCKQQAEELALFFSLEVSVETERGQTGWACLRVCILVRFYPGSVAWPDPDSPLQDAPGLSTLCLHTWHTCRFLKLFTVKVRLPDLASCRDTRDGQSWSQRQVCMTETSAAPWK